MVRFITLFAANPVALVFCVFSITVLIAVSLVASRVILLGPEVPVILEVSFSILLVVLSMN